MTLSGVATVLLWILLALRLLPVAWNMFRAFDDERSMRKIGEAVGAFVVIFIITVLWLTFFRVLQDLAATDMPGFEIIVPFYLVGRQVMLWLPHRSNWDDLKRLWGDVRNRYQRTSA